MKRINYHLALLIFIVIITFVFHYISLAQTKYANGWDSYFYLLQVKSLIEHGHLISSRISIIYPVLVVFKWISGDYIIGWKIFVSVCSALAVILSYKVVNELTLNKAAALLSAAITLCSPHLFYFSSQYAKNLLGFDCFLLFLLLLFKRKYIIAILFVIINLLVHKLTGALSIMTLVIFIAYNILAKQSKNRVLLWSIIPVVAVLFIPKILGIHDFARQADLITLKPQFTLISFFSDFEGLVSPIWKGEIILVYLLLVAVVFILIKKQTKAFNYWIIPLLFIILNLPFLKWDLNGFSFRFFLFSILFGAIFGAIILAEFNSKISYVLIVLLIGATTFSYKAYNPMLHDPNNNEYDRVISKLQSSGILSKSELLIAHKGLAEYIKFNTNKDAMSWIPEYEINDDSLWRISAGIRTHRLNAAISSDSIIKLGYDYNVIKEKDWQSFLQYVKQTNSDFYDDYTTWLNPNKQRPLFMQKYRRVEE